MNKQNTRWGFTQEMKNAVIKNGHSRRLLSGIFNASCNKIGEKTLLNKYVEDPRLQLSGMTPNFITTRGFTLIELLVVVLIIAILAAVAVPQYNKAVAKSRGAEALEAVNTLDKALAAYYLEHGSYEGASAETLNVQLPELKHFRYVVGTNIFENGSYSLPTLETYNANNQTGIFIVEPSNMGIHAVWEKGKLKEKGCTRLTNSYECDYYFHCNWKIQVGTDGSITSKWCVFD